MRGSFALDTPAPSDQACLTGGGTIGELFRAQDWDPATLGPPRGWPQSLKTSVSICLNSHFAGVVWWGHQLACIYNDACIPMLGDKHPGALGRQGREVWPEVWPTIGPMLETVLQTGTAIWNADLLLMVERCGYLEECYFTFSCSGIRAETGEVGGVFTAVLETTDKVLRERRLRTLRDLACAGRDPRDRRAAFAAAGTVLAANAHDLPFFALYDLPVGARVGTLVQAAGIDLAPDQFAQSLPLDSASGHPLAAACRRACVSGAPVEMALPALPMPSSGPWRVPSRTLLVMAISPAGRQEVCGFLVCGLNPHRSLDSDYFGFCELVDRELAAAIAAADTCVQQRQRADALAEIDRAKTGFFTTVSHEFRTPLTLMLEPLSRPTPLPRATQQFVDGAILWLPATQPDASAADPAGDPSTAVLATVLVAEDDADMRQAFHRALSPRYKVRLASSGADALNTLRQEHVDLLVTDIMMPGIDGLKVLQAVRADPALQALPVILVSGRAGDDERRIALAARADDYLVKPIRPSELVARVEQQLAICALRREISAREHRLQMQTEQIRAAEQLRASEDLQKIIFDHAPGGIGLCDPAGRHVRTNRALQELLGYSAEELQQLTVRDVTEAADWPENQRMRDELLSGRRDVITFKKRMRTKGQRIVWVRNTVTVVKDAAGTPRFTLAQVEDVSEQVESQRRNDLQAARSRALAELSLLSLHEEGLAHALQLAVEMAAALLEVPRAVIFEYREGMFQLMVRAGQGWPQWAESAVAVPDDPTHWLGYALRVPVSSAAQGSSLALMVNDIATEIRFSLPEALAQCGVRSGMTAVLISPEGAYGLLGIFAGEARNYDDDEAQFLQALANVVAAAASRSKALAALRESRHLLARAQEIAGLGWWEYDPEQDTLRWSAEVEAFLGQPQLTGRVGLTTAIALLHEDDRESVASALRTAIAGGHRCQFECRVQRAGSDSLTLLVIGQPTADEGDRPAKFVGSAMDVTESRRAAQAIQKSADQLRALTRRLVRVQEAERRQFASELHDKVGQNLTALAINLEIVSSNRITNANGQAGGDRARLEDSLALVQATSAAISDVLAELRPPMLDDYGLGAALRWMGGLFSRRTQVKVQVRGSDCRPEESCRDRDLALFRIAQEAFNNIAKHAQASSVAVQLDEDGRGLELSICDDGIGFDSELARHGDVSLGMKTMRERAAAVGGVFRIESQPGHGTRIVVQVSQ